MLVTFVLLISVQFTSDPCCICRYFDPIFLCAQNIHLWVSVDCLCYWPCRACSWCVNERGGVILVEKYITRVCARNCSDARFITHSLGLILVPSLDPDTAGNWRGEICGSCGIKTSRLQLKYGHYSSDARAKWVRPFSLPWVNSNLWVWPGPPFQACRQHKWQIEKKNQLLVSFLIVLILLLFFSHRSRILFIGSCL